ncbi:hypothetical protein BMS3Abin02_01504 [bacterium BMS3Abin02]|nr:hypothetical protein BMS3Abin02_01504 [bacterium BMS3Abin02]GBE21433.1 hypothetical protein BMS3Bbin01_00778 [bacterium BMS3Bbin01]
MAFPYLSAGFRSGRTKKRCEPTASWHLFIALSYEIVREILSDLVAEEQALDQLLQKIAIRDWKRRTPTNNWSIQDIVAFLASSEEFALRVLQEGRAPLVETETYASLEDFATSGIDRGRSMRPQDVIEWWRGARAGVVDALSRMTRSQRIPWFVDDISAQTFATARLAEAWAYGLDVQSVAETQLEDTPRLRHIAWLAWRTLPYAFKRAGHAYVPVRVEVIGPGYAKWVYGPEDSGQRIKGSAGEWCRVAVRRLSASETSLSAEGEAAELALLIASTAV